MTSSCWSHEILPLREQSRVRRGWQKERLDTLLPVIMKREGFDMWIVVSREYNDDPVVMSLIPECGDFGMVLSPSRRRTILLFALQDDGTVDRMELGGPGLTGLYRDVWLDRSEEQWACLGRVVCERNPKRIALDTSPDSALSDGLSYTEHEKLMRALGDCASRASDSTPLVIRWLEHRTDVELAAYPRIVAIAHGIIAEAFSERVVHPGVTTATDVSWWIRQRIRDLGLAAWFHPTIMIQRAVSGGGEIVMPGDVLHCDVGVNYLGLCTDNQHLAYVLAPGETDAPAGLKSAYAAGCRMQDLVAAEFVAGRTGNDILARSLATARSEGLKAMVYSHPIGYHGHGAGPAIGQWDRQDGVPGRGDYEVRDCTCYALELNVRQPVPEWEGRDITIYLEETIAFRNGRIDYLDGRQEHFHLIG